MTPEQWLPAAPLATFTIVSKQMCRKHPNLTCCRGKVAACCVAAGAEPFTPGLRTGRTAKDKPTDARVARQDPTQRMWGMSPPVYDKALRCFNLIDMCLMFVVCYFMVSFECVAGQ